MTREIKFRAWDIDLQKWRYLEFPHDLVNLHSNYEGTLNLINWCEFTGLRDKNGKEIYEGDVLKDDQGDLFEVKFGKLPLQKAGDCVCTYEAFYAKNYGQLGRAPFYECAEIAEWMEIIGNTYENPELLYETTI